MLKEMIAKFVIGIEDNQVDLTFVSFSIPCFEFTSLLLPAQSQQLPFLSALLATGY